MSVSESPLSPRLLKGRLGAAAGMIGPVMFLGILAILDILDHRVDVSGHELGRYGIVQHLNFLLFGLLLFAFAAALRSHVRRGKLAWAGTILLGVLSFGLALGTFTLDPGSGPPSTWHGTPAFRGFPSHIADADSRVPRFRSAVQARPSVALVLLVLRGHRHCADNRDLRSAHINR
jgi:hypothetical protein